MTPEELENEIDLAAMRMATGKTEAIRRQAWTRLKYLHSLRSPQKVCEMEERQGLA